MKNENLTNKRTFHSRCTTNVATIKKMLIIISLYTVYLRHAAETLTYVHMHAYHSDTEILNKEHSIQMRTYYEQYIFPTHFLEQ